ETATNSQPPAPPGPRTTESPTLTRRTRQQRPTTAPSRGQRQPARHQRQHRVRCKAEQRISSDKINRQAPPPTAHLWLAALVQHQADKAVRMADVVADEICAPNLAISTATRADAAK